MSDHSSPSCTPSVLYLAPNVLGPPGGIARYIRMVCTALPQQSGLVTLISLLDSPHSTASANRLLPGVNYLPCDGDRTRFIRQALSQTITRRPELVIVGHVNFATLGWLAARLGRAHLITFVYGIDAWEPLPLARRWGLLHAERVVSISGYTAQQAIRANRLAPEGIRILHNCLDPQLVPAQRASPATGSRPIMLAVARLSRLEQYKGHDQVIHALPSLLERFPDLLFDVVGDGDWRSDLEALAAKLGVSNAVRFRGRISDAEMLRCYADATLFVLPSRAEGFGFVFLEAMAHGLPVIGGVMDATPEVVIHGETGLLVDPTSPVQIADAVASLLADPDRRKKMGAAAQRRVEEQFSFARFQQQLLTILGELDFRVSASA